MKFLVVIACLFAFANAHTCLLHPEQRGPIPSDVLIKPGDDVCAITTPPCGNTDSEPPKVTFTAGYNGTVNVQKNLDHFYPSNPGRWELNILSSGASFGRSVAWFPDSSEFKTLDTRIVTVSIPYDTPKGVATLQLVYRTNNPNAPAAFYQCADVTII